MRRSRRYTKAKTKSVIFILEVCEKRPRRRMTSIYTGRPQPKTHNNGYTYIAAAPAHENFVVVAGVCDLIYVVWCTH